MQITLVFDSQSAHPSTVRIFARCCKKHYNTQTSYYKNTKVVEVIVDEIYKNNIIHTALSYGFTILHV